MSEGSAIQEANGVALLRLHHLKFAVSRLDIALVWYERVLGARRGPELDHFRADGTRFAVVCKLEDWSGLYIELREDQNQARKDQGWDPVTLLTRGREDLVAWMLWLSGWGTSHSPLLIGIRGWILVFQDHDGRRYQIYTEDRHDGSLPVSTDHNWLTES